MLALFLQETRPRQGNRERLFCFSIPLVSPLTSVLCSSSPSSYILLFSGGALQAGEGAVTNLTSVTFIRNRSEKHGGKLLLVVVGGGGEGGRSECAVVYVYVVSRCHPY